MNAFDRTFDEDDRRPDWAALAWIVTAALLAVGAFLLAPLG